MRKLFLVITLLTVTFLVISCDSNRTTEALTTTEASTTIETTNELYSGLNIDSETYAGLINYINVFDLSNVSIIDINEKYSLFRGVKSSYYLFDKDNQILTDLAGTLNPTIDSRGNYNIGFRYNSDLKIAFVYSDTVWVKITETEVGEPNIIETGEQIEFLNLINDDTYHIQKYNVDAGYQESRYLEIRNISDNQIIAQMDKLSYINHGLYMLFGEYFTEFYQLLDGEFIYITSTLIATHGFSNSIQENILMIEGTTTMNYNTYYFFEIAGNGELTYLKSMNAMDGYFLSDYIVLDKGTEYQIYNLAFDLLNTLPISEDETVNCFPIDGSYYLKLTPDKIGIYQYDGQLVNEFDLILEQYLKSIRAQLDGSYYIQTRGRYSIQTYELVYLFDGETLSEAEKVYTVNPYKCISLVEEDGEIKTYRYDGEETTELFLNEVIELVEEENIDFDNVIIKYFDGVVTVFIFGLQEGDSNIFIYKDNELLLSGQILGHIFDIDILILTEAGKVVCFDSEEPNRVD